MPEKKQRRGFTLIELLVVIAIIGILATIATISLTGARSKSRDARRVADIKQIQTALELFFNDNGRYPTANEFASGSLYSTSSGNAVVYMNSIPSAPTPADGNCNANDNAYRYLISGDNSTYRLDFCIGGRTGSVDGGLIAGTPVGIIRLAQGVFVDEALQGIKVVAGEGNKDLKQSLDSDIIVETNSIGVFKYPEGSEKVYFFAEADNSQKIKIGEIESQKIASDLVVTLPEAVLDRGKYGDDSKKLREMLDTEEVVNMARLLNAITDKSKTFALGREINTKKVGALKQYMVEHKSSYMNEKEVIERVPEFEKLGTVGTLPDKTSMVQTLKETLENVNGGKYTPNKNSMAVDGSHTSICDDTVGPCNFSSCGDTITYQGEKYETVSIGKQCWFKQNLNVGTMLKSFDALPSDDKTTEKWCPANKSEDSSQNSTLCSRFGALYSWTEALALPAKCREFDFYCKDDVQCEAKLSECNFTYPRQGICPTGWHIPSKTDFNTLSSYIGSCDFNSNGACKYGYQLKEEGTANWIKNNCGDGKCNTTGFTALPSGFIITSKNMWTNSYGDLGQLMSSALKSSTVFFATKLYGGKEEFVASQGDIKDTGMGVRCVQDTAK